MVLMTYGVPIGFGVGATYYTIVIFGPPVLNKIREESKNRGKAPWHLDGPAEWLFMK